MSSLTVGRAASARSRHSSSSSAGEIDLGATWLDGRRRSAILMRRKNCVDISSVSRLAHLESAQLVPSPHSAQEGGGGGGRSCRPRRRGRRPGAPMAIPIEQGPECWRRRVAPVKWPQFARVAGRPEPGNKLARGRPTPESDSGGTLRPAPNGPAPACVLHRLRGRERCESGQGVTVEANLVGRTGRTRGGGRSEREHLTAQKDAPRPSVRQSVSPFVCLSV